MTTDIKNPNDPRYLAGEQTKELSDEEKKSVQEDAEAQGKSTQLGTPEEEAKKAQDIRANALGLNPFGVSGQLDAANLQSRAQRLYQAHAAALPGNDPGYGLMWDQIPQQTKDAWISAAKVDHDAKPMAQAAMAQAAGSNPAAATTPGLAGHAGQGAPGKNLDLNADYAPGGPKEGELKPGKDQKDPVKEATHQAKEAEQKSSSRK